MILSILIATGNWKKYSDLVSFNVSPCEVLAIIYTFIVTISVLAQESYSTDFYSVCREVS